MIINLEDGLLELTEDDLDTLGVRPGTDEETSRLGLATLIGFAAIITEAEGTSYQEARGAFMAALNEAYGINA